ncbi:MAG: PAS domain S-box protein [Armatimonadota bacterium]
MSWYVNFVSVIDDKPNGGLPNQQYPAWVRYAATVVIEIALTGILLFVQRFLPLGQYPISYVLAIMLVAYYFGEGPAILAFLLGLFIFEYFFVPPFYTPLPHAETPMGWAAIIAFLLGTSVVSIATIVIRKSKRRVERIASDLLESQKDLNRAQTVAHTGSWRLDIRQNKLLWSDETYRIFGIPIGTQMIYENFLAAVHPDDRGYVEQKWADALSGKPYDIEHRIVVGGTEKWVREKAELEFDGYGKLLGGFGTVQDVTERKEAEERIRQINQDLKLRNAELTAERERWQGVVEGMADEVWIADTQGKMALINLPAVTQMGLEAFKDKTVYEVLEEVDILNPDGQLRPPQEAPLLRSLRGEIVRGEEMMRHRRTGKVRWRQFSSAPTRDAAGKITGAVAIVRDVTEQKETEQALRSEQEHKLAFYQATIMAATNGKLVITERPGIEQIAGSAVASWEISRPEEIGMVRRGVEEIAVTAGMEEAKIGELLVCVGEAGQNVVKHAGQGEVSVHKMEDALIIVVSDRGPGIPALALPNVALRPGYSTVGTLGMGYKMMIQFADKIYLATGPEGTTVGIEMKLHQVELQAGAAIMEKFGL